MKLYWFWSMNPQKVRLALNELGLPHDIVKVDLGKREQRAPEFPALNPNRKVPVLDDDGFVLWESNAMLAYLGERERRLWPLDARGRADALRWLFFESRHLSELGGALWFNDFVASMARIPIDEAARQRGEENLPTSLRIVEQHLASSEWMLKDAFSLVDCCYGPLLDALALSRFDLHDYPAVRSYVERMRGRPAWRQCEFLTARV